MRPDPNKGGAMSKKPWAFIAVLALAVIVPQAVYAAIGSFSSASSTTALTATNSSTGRAFVGTSSTGITGLLTRNATSGGLPTLQATSKSATSGASGVFGYNVSTSTGATYGVYGRSNATSGRGVYGQGAATSGTNFGVYGHSSSTAGRGVFGLGAATSGANYGVYGRSLSPAGTGVYGLNATSTGLGVWGDAGDTGVLGTGLIGVVGGGLFGVLGFGGTDPAANGVFGFADAGGGVVGESFDIGDGSFGVYSNTDIGVLGHVVAKDGQVAGTCTVAVTLTTATCTFPLAFGAGVTPIVVITPAEDPGAIVSWVTAGSPATDSFVINLSAGATGDGLTFNYIVVGVDGTLGPLVSPRLQGTRYARYLRSER